MIHEDNEKFDPLVHRSDKSIYELIKNNDVAAIIFWVKNQPELDKNTYEHLVSMRKLDLYSSANAIEDGHKSQKLINMFNNTRYALGLDTNLPCESKLWNPLLYAIDQK